MLRLIVQRFDAWLCRRYGVFEFSHDPDCIFRLQIADASHRIALPDCTVERGEMVLFLHLWNERIQMLDSISPGLAMAKHLQRAFLYSLREIAAYLDERPDMAKVRAIGGVTILLNAGDHEGGVRLVERLGFTVLPYYSPLGNFGEFWENFYSWILIWTYNPSTLPFRPLRNLKRKEFWMSIDGFQRQFGHGR